MSFNIILFVRKVITLKSEVIDGYSQGLPVPGTKSQCLVNDNNLTDEQVGETCSVDPVSDQLIEGEHLCISLETDTCCSSVKSNLRFIIDSGASSHMTPSKCLLYDINTAVNGSVSLGDVSKKLVIVGAGKTAIPILGIMYLVPKLSFGLISIPTLDKVGCRTMFSDGRVFVFNRDGKLLLTGTLDNKLYYLDAKYVNILYNSSSCSEYECDEYVELVTDDILCASDEECTLCKVNDVVESSDDVENPCMLASSSTEARLVQGSAPKRLGGTTIGLSPLEVLHLRMGHLGEHNIKKALKLKMVTGAKYSYEDVKDSKLRICFGCMRGRMKAFVDSTGTMREYKPFEKIAIDYKGKFPIKSKHGNDGFYLVSDTSTDYVCAYPCKNKGVPTILSVLDSYRTDIVEMNKFQISKLQADFDSVILSDEVHDWLVNYHIKLQVSAPYSHAQNGQVERDMQNVLDKARTLLAVYDVPRMYWDYAVKIACYLINRSPTANSDKTPYERVYGEVPDISHLVPFYAPGVYHLTREERHNSLSDKAVLCRMLGYDEKCKNTYKVLNINNGAIVSRKDCIFDESLGDIITMNDIRDNLDSDKYIEDSDDDDNEDVTDEHIDNNTDNNNDDESVDNDVDADGYSGGEDLIDPYWNTSDGDHLNYSDLDCYLVCVAAQVHGAVMLPKNPDSIAEALAGPEGDQWKEAMRKELINFDDRDVFALASQEGRAMKTKWILKYAYNTDYTIKYKARLVACGYSQIYGIDYKDTYAPTTSTILVNVIFHLIGMYNLVKATFDVTAAFLEGKNDFVQYARLPFDDNGDNAMKGQGMRVEVVGNFYGEKQGPKIWNDQLDSILVGIGFVRSPVHNCLYRWVCDLGFVVLTVHVDDGLMASSNGELYIIFETEFVKRVKKMTMSLEFRKHLGMDVNFVFNAEGSKVELSHLVYITARYDEFTKTVRTPMSATANLREAVGNSKNESLLPDTGAFRFIADRARPDILVVAGELATGGADGPSDLHVKTSKRTKDYLNSTKDMCLSLGGLGKLAVFAYSDASYITTGNCKSRLGGCIFMGYDSGAVFSFSKNSTNVSTISHSSTESEILAIDMLVRELQHLHDILKFIVGEVELPIKVYVDNTSAIALLESLKGNNRVKHINVRIAYIRELVMSGFIELHFVPTNFNVADILTKALSPEQYEFLRYILMKGHGGVMPCFVNCVDLKAAVTIVSLMCIEFNDIEL